jgi:hypothetical protein
MTNINGIHLQEAPPDIMPKCPHYGCLIDRVYPGKGAFLTGSWLPAKEINITYHYSCHLKRECGIETQPRDVLSAIFPDSPKNFFLLFLFVILDIVIYILFFLLIGPHDGERR